MKQKKIGFLFFSLIEYNRLHVKRTFDFLFVEIACIFFEIKKQTQQIMAIFFI